MHLLIKVSFKRAILKLNLFALALLFIGTHLMAQTDEQPKSVLKKKHKEFSSWKYGMFLHFNLATYTGREWTNGHEDPLLFNPAKLDCNQWMSAIKAAGMNYAVLTVKHTEAYPLWDSKYTDHDITAFKNYKDGKGDIVREYVNACRENKIKVGLYYCLPGDFGVDKVWSNPLQNGQKDYHGLPFEAEGDFAGFIEKQVTELLTNYGSIDLIWFDQYSNKYTGKDWLRLKTLVHKLQPMCIVVANNSKSYKESDIIGYEYRYLMQVSPDKALPQIGNKDVAELCDNLDDNGWFWHAGEKKMKSAKTVAEMLKLCQSRKTNLLLDVPPSPDGLIEQVYIDRLVEIRKLTFGKSQISSS